jgi:hypothetical protein
MAREFPLAFYNVQVNRDPNRVDKEIRALLARRPAVLGLCETIGYDLPCPDDYRVIRDRSNKSRANIAAYVKQNLDLSDKKWHDLKETWSRTETTGTHEPRSILEFRAGRLMVWVAHQPPKGTDNTQAAQMEGIDKLTARMAPWTREDWDDRTEADKAAAKDQARVVLWDSNRGPNEDGPGPEMLCNRIDGESIGAQIDNAVGRGGSVKCGKDARYLHSVDGVEMKSDHYDAFLFTAVLYDS